MTIVLTDAEVDKVNSLSKPDAQLPTYYNASTKLDTPISRDFEAFLILMDADSRQLTVDWLSKVRDLESAQKDRDALILEALDNEVADAQARKDEIDTQLEDFDQFRAAFKTTGFTSVNEVGLLLTDLQTSIDELTMRRDRNNHMLFSAQFLQVNVATFTEDDKKELDSWSEVITAY